MQRETVFKCMYVFLGYSFVSLDPLYSLTESDIHDRQLPEGIGARWKDLARKLGFKERSIEVIERENCSYHDRCIKLLVRWMEKGGQHGATAGKLAEALKAIELQSLADRLIGILNFFRLLAIFWCFICFFPMHLFEMCFMAL